MRITFPTTPEMDTKSWPVHFCSLWRLTKQTVFWGARHAFLPNKENGKLRDEPILSLDMVLITMEHGVLF